MKQGDLFAASDEPSPERRSTSPAPPAAGDPQVARAAQADRSAAEEAVRAERASQSSATGSAGAIGDAGERRVAVTEFQAPILLAAGAGTGKTATLVARVLHGCLGPVWDSVERARGARSGEDASREDLAVDVLRGVAAITFTEAAAAEMSTRLAETLADVQERAARAREGESVSFPVGFVPEALPGDPAELFERARALRSALDHLGVSTIHAFCRRLLSAHPLAVGLDPAFEVDATGRRLEAIGREVMEAFLAEAWAEPVNEDLVELARRGQGAPEVEAALLALVDGGANATDLAADPFDAASCREAFALLSEAQGHAAGAAAELAGKAGNTGLAYDAIASTGRALLAPEVGDCTAVDELEALAVGVRTAWTGEDGAKAFERLKTWAKSEFNKGESKALGGEPDDPSEPMQVLAGACLELRLALEPFLEIDRGLLEPARRVLGRLLDDLHRELRRRGVATFSDLLTEAGRLLREHPAIAARERRRLHMLLVDEFQDTDALQCEIVGRLALEGPPEERPSLFLVGDPKQSIFAWRSADLAAFDDFAERVEAAGGLRLELTTNFRSRASVLEEVARVVDPVMEEMRGVQPRFVGLEPGRAEADGGEVEVWASWPRDPADGRLDARRDLPRAASYRSEARALARDVFERRGTEDLEWSDFAIQFRAMTDVEPYLQELRELGIPYEVQNDRKYYQRREIIDAAALVRTVLDPHDHLALLAFLRSPMVGVPDAALLPLFEVGLPGELATLFAPDPDRLAELAALATSAAERVPVEAVPGLASIGDWCASLVDALRGLAESRAAFAEEPLDRWIDGLRARFLPDVVESARFLGEFRQANLERFFREVQRAFEERGGDVSGVVRLLRASLGDQDRRENARPADSAESAVRILTIHGAKGLEFEHVYLPQAHKGKRGGESERTAFATLPSDDGPRPAYVLFGTPSPAWFAVRRRRELAEAAERVRLLYVALTRAKRRLVVLGGFGIDEKKPRDRGWREAGRIDDLLLWRADARAQLAELLALDAAGKPARLTDRFGTLWRLTEPARDEASDEPVSTNQPSGDEPLPVARAEREGRELAEARAAARVRSARPFARAASAEAHVEGIERSVDARFESSQGGEEARTPLRTRTPDEAEAAPTAAVDRIAAQRAGTAIHRLLEVCDPLANPADERTRLAGLLPGILESLTPAAEAPRRRLATEERAGALLARLDEHGWLERLAALGDRIVARELPVLVPVDDDVAGADPTAPVGYVSGAVDLVYRDADGSLVIVDYKTDPVADEELEARAATYVRQGRVYQEALEESLGLEGRRFELWFLDAGRVL